MIGRMYRLFLIYSIVNLSPTVSSSDGNVITSAPESCASSPEQGNGNIPAYSLYILGTISILLLIALIALIVYVFLRPKFQKFHITTQLENGAQCPTCQKTSGSKRESENNQSIIRIESKSITTNDFTTNTLRSLKKLEASSDKSPKFTKGVAKDLSYILPNQITSICKEVLKRTDENDLSSSLQKIDQLVNEGKLQEATSSKCASIASLDTYDTLPKTYCGRKLNKQRGGNIKTSGKVKPKSNCEIYDFPKEQNSLYDFPKRGDGVKISNISDNNPKSNLEIYDFPKEHNSVRHLPKSNDGSSDRNPGIYDFPPPSKHLKSKCKTPDYGQTEDKSFKQSVIRPESIDDSTDNIYMNANDIEML